MLIIVFHRPNMSQPYCSGFNSITLNKRVIGVLVAFIYLHLPFAYVNSTHRIILSVEYTILHACFVYFSLSLCNITVTKFFALISSQPSYHFMSP